ncbi:transglutaminase family protein [Luteolibacter pohnpeiensis]|uniref:Transglutaminase family protein n=1 Tax=Luteolibacter pohnpeiensis TaxID=454153 RepID=A0A934VX62_9BACT|nr:transglutaminase family protein [Luteolibacter pohnpeiensis]MBK1884015.1 transglutaminase family protein [Luteolibacter pohnpeiensis]
MPTSPLPPASDELDALLRLIDDDTPEVRRWVADRFADSTGDLSEWLATRPHKLDHHERELLTTMLAPPRRAALAREWVVPTGGAKAMREDWDSFEALLRALSDFLHDGITLRQPLSDALDLLAEEATEEGVYSENELRGFLFESKRLVGNRADYYDPRNSDLAWAISEGKSNPLGLCLIYILLARRLDLEVQGINFPGHFLCRFYEDGLAYIVDCFDGGRLHPQDILLANADELTSSQKQQLRQTTDPGTIMIRLLNNLIGSLQNAGRSEDAGLIESLRSTLGQ